MNAAQKINDRFTTIYVKNTVNQISEVVNSAQARQSTKSVRVEAICAFVTCDFVTLSPSRKCRMV